MILVLSMHRLEKVKVVESRKNYKKMIRTQNMRDMFTNEYSNINKLIGQ